MNWIENKRPNLQIMNSRIAKSIESNIMTNNGPVVRELEAFLHQTLKIDNDRAVICFVNATAALQALPDIFDNGKGWATSDFTFPASHCGSLRYSKVYDIDEAGGLDLSEKPQENLIVTNIFGYLTDITKYVKYCKDNDLFLVFDNAATPFSFFDGKNSLNYGDAAIISLHHTKLIGFSEGGAMIVPKSLEDKVRRLICFGFGENDRNYQPWGNNYKMHEVTAAMILTYLEENFIEIVNHATMLHKFVRLNGGQLFSHSSNITPSCLCFVGPRFTEEQVAKLGCKKYYKPLVGLPRATRLYNKIICVPCHRGIAIEDLLPILELC